MVRRLAVLGGSFDPPHLGHLHMVRAVVRALAPIEVRLLPAACPPHKVGQPRANAEDRRVLCELLAEAAGGGVTVDDRELRRGGVSYTRDTVREYLAEQPTELYFVIGADSLEDLGSWRDIQALVREVTFVTVPRPGLDPAGCWPALEAVLGADAVRRLAAHVVDMEPRAESSTDVRQAIREGRPWRHLVPAAVAERIERRGLYRD